MVIEPGHLIVFDPASSLFVPAALDYRSHGAELEVEAQITRALKLSAGVGYTRAELVDVRGSTTTGARSGTARAPDIAIAGAVAIGASVSGIYIVLGTLILAWARGNQAATDYALLYGVGRFIGTLALLGLPSLIPVVGWSAFYVACCVALIGALWIFMSEARSDSAGDAAARATRFSSARNAGDGS